jgi:cytochrome P450
MVASWERYGDVFSARFPIYGRVVYVADPSEIKRVFAGSPALMHAGEANALALGEALGDNSLLTLDEDAHMSQRKLLLPPFHGESVRRYTEVMAEATAREVNSWPLGSPFPMRPRIQSITLEVILRAVFGVREGERMDEFRLAIPRLAETTSLLTMLPVLRRERPWTPMGRLRRALAHVDRLVYAAIHERRANPAGDDVLSLLLSARHDDGSPMSDTELRDELLTLLTAGHETTATGLSWAFERLVRTPRVMERLCSDLDDDAYLDAVVREALRIRPVVVDVARKLSADFEIGGHIVPAGTLAVPAIAVMHARPDIWGDPDAFRPERFLEEAQAPYTWLPFGGGVRRCIGAAFAQIEMRVVLREVLRRVRLRADRARSERPRTAHVTVVPARGARVVCTSRAPSASAPVALAAPGGEPARA